MLEAYRGQGLGRWLMECIITAPELKGIRRLLLATSDAHDFYRKLGFAPVSGSDIWLEMLFERTWFRPG